MMSAVVLPRAFAHRSGAALLALMDDEPERIHLFDLRVVIGGEEAAARVGLSAQWDERGALCAYAEKKTVFDLWFLRTYVACGSYVLYVLMWLFANWGARSPA